MLLPHNELPVMVGGVGGITPLDIPPIPPLYSQRGPQLQNGARTLNRSRASSPQSIKAIQENGKDGKSGSLSIHSILSRSCPKTNIMHCIVSGAPNTLFLWEPRGALGNLWEPFGAFRSLAVGFWDSLGASGNLSGNLSEPQPIKPARIGGSLNRNRIGIVM
jgi:hypothetical protein